MDFLVPLIKVVHLIVSVILILIILVQPSKSGDIGAMFGGGTSESVFGSVGAVPFLVKLTRLFAFVFIVTSLSLGYFSVKSISSSVVDDTVIDIPSAEKSTDGESDIDNEEITNPDEEVNQLKGAFGGDNLDLEIKSEQPDSATNTSEETPKAE
ncbi:MAG: preprotein translocase subunit SecG [Thermodesulfobacteriota bacterium]